jgi:O-Antigen ligase/Tetratricopeptide repeat
LAAAAIATASPLVARVGQATVALGGRVGSTLFQRQLVDRGPGAAGGRIARAGGTSVCCPRMQWQEEKGNPGESGKSAHSLGMVEGSAPLDGATVSTAVLGVLLLASILWDGAFDLRYWAPLTLLALCLLIAQIVGGTLRRPRGALLVATAGVWALAAFTLLSAVWSASASLAAGDAARMAFYAALWTLAASVTGGRRSWRSVLAAGLTVGVAAVAAITLIGLLADGPSMFRAGRLESPLGYRNATAALFAFAVWPLLGFAARRGGAAPLRGMSLASAFLALGLAFLTQSRGVVLGLLVGGAVSLAIGPDRLRRAWLAVALVGVLGAFSSQLLAPYDAFTAGTLVPDASDVSEATSALAIGSVAVLLLGTFVFVFDNGLRSGRFEERARIAGAVGLAALVLVGVVGGLAAVGNPVDYADEKIQEFKEVEPQATTSSTRLATVGGQRSDLWRVAWLEFRDDPVAGAGVGSYPADYYLHRRTDRNLDNPHSLPLKMLGEGGVIGFALLLTWVLAGAVAVARSCRGRSGAERAWIAGLASAAAVILAQCLVDWFWLLPGLFGLAVLAFALAAARPDEDPPGAGAGVARLVPAALLAAAALSVGALFLADFYERKARVEAVSAPQEQLSAARTAADLDPLSVTPLYLQASALETLGDRNAAKSALLDALELEPENFVTFGLLGDFQVRAGHPRAARAYYRKALRLNPRDIGLRELSEGIR